MNYLIRKSTIFGVTITSWIDEDFVRFIVFDKEFSLSIDFGKLEIPNIKDNKELLDKVLSAAQLPQKESEDLFVFLLQKFLNGFSYYKNF